MFPSALKICLSCLIGSLRRCLQPLGLGQSEPKNLRFRLGLPGTWPNARICPCVLQPCQAYQQERGLGLERHPVWCAGVVNSDSTRRVPQRLGDRDVV